MLALIQKVNGFSMFLAVHFHTLPKRLSLKHTYKRYKNDCLNKLKSTIPYTAVINVS